MRQFHRRVPNGYFGGWVELPGRVESRAVRERPPRERRPAAALLLALTAPLVPLACAGSEVRVVGHTVTARGLSYSFGPVPSGWRRIRVEDNDAAWFDPETLGAVHVDHTCDRSMDTPLPALVQHLLIGFTERRFELEETVPFDGREARHVVLHARLDGVPRSLELYVMKKDGCVYDLGYIAPPDRFAAGRPGFDAFARGFRTTRSPLDRP